ncbi:MAG: aromatic amino acid hydroxylase [Zetaproteobacteria bacterium]|nr:aromatic amino acid hydroxylase [Zetaproteobacteria bacterium]
MSDIDVSFVPEYLKPYIFTQNYERYTPREHATWRFIMRQSLYFFKSHAHPCYLEGLQATGISIEYIPRIRDIDQCLQQFGWRAVGIRGFIPTLVFLDFQSRRILPIATDMRTLEHIGYTPAPDIVHEAAGHAPILANAEYRKYIEKYAAIARKCLYSNQDIRLYEAIRSLSDVKENPDTTSEQLATCQKELQAAQKAVTWDSEAALVSRLYWWTAEYGLVGDPQNPKIYGAGLLSSVEEGKTSVSATTPKRILDIHCVETNYDITEPQPQLFITPGFEHLSSVLSELEATLSYRQGGVTALEMAIKAKTVTTVVFANGLSVSGILSHFRLNSNQEPIYLKWSGPVQIAEGHAQLTGHGVSRHGEGMSTPLGNWLVEGQATDISTWTPQDWELSCWQGRELELKHEHGYTLQGVCMDALFCSETLSLITFSNCTLTDHLGNILFQPEWGEFDMLVSASHIPSVYGGPADWHAYGAHNVGTASTVPGRVSPFTLVENKNFNHYTTLTKLRQEDTQLKEQYSKDPNLLEQLVHNLCAEEHTDWLVGLEWIELLRQPKIQSLQANWAELIDTIKGARFIQKHKHDPHVWELWQRGLAIAHQTSEQLQRQTKG